MTQPRGRARELSILAIVLELLTEQGYERLSVDAVAARAKASKATIYSRWPDKATLVAAALIARSLDQPTPEWSGDSLRDDARAFVELCVLLAETESLPAFISVLIAAETEPTLAEAVHSTALAPRRRDAAAIVGHAAERGELGRAHSGEELFDLVMGKILVRYVVERRPLTADEREAFVDDILLPVLRG